MSFDHSIASVDLLRVSRVLEKFALREFDSYSLTGSLATEAHRMRLGTVPHARPLNDVDLLVQSFSVIPSALSTDFLVRHVHPDAPKGKMLIQLVDPDEVLRIDIFREYGATIARSQSMRFGTRLIQVTSLDDLAARIASILMDLERGRVVARKHVEDFHFLSQAVDVDRVELAWQDHRKPTDPSAFREALTQIRGLVESHNELIVVPEYSRDANAACSKCEETGPFRLASASAVMSILGYC